VGWVCASRTAWRLQKFAQGRGGERKRSRDIKTLQVILRYVDPVHAETLVVGGGAEKRD